jgi:hypothetical protein
LSALALGVNKLTGQVALAGVVPYPPENPDGANAAAFAEPAQHKDVAIGVKACPSSVGVGANLVLKEPEADIGVPAVVETVLAKDEDLVGCIGIDVLGCVCVGDVIF